MVVEEMIEHVEKLRIYYEGSGDPKDQHSIIGIRYIDDDGEHRYIGDYEKMLLPDKRC